MGIQSFPGAAPDMLLLGERFSLLSSRCILLVADETRRVEYMVHLDKPAMCEGSTRTRWFGEVKMLT